MEKISFVVPCYRSENTITSVVEEVKTEMAAHPDYDYEIVLVNDNSPDNVWDVITKLSESDKRIKAIRLLRNFGQHSALMAGYGVCTGDYVVTIDDDGQTPVDQTFILMDKLLEGFDVVYGKYEKRKDNLFRKIGTGINNWMSKTLLGKPKDLHLTSFFVARAKIIKEICNYKNGFPYIWGLVLRTTKSIANATIQHKERIEGESGYTLGKLLNLWMNGFTAFSVKPLRISATVGVISSALGLLGIIYVVVDKIIHPEVAAGFSSLMAVLLLIGGLLLLSMGLIGEYVGRIYMCINATPQYIVRDTINLPEPEDGK
ncbi:MAG: glycosyltransferase family 2 protein [Lachnospiraceae bacterium]